MLRIVYHPDWHVLSGYARGQLVLAARERRAGQVLIVPEQFSFETERALCDEGGALFSRYAEVLSFSRLAERSLSVCGGIARPVTDQGGRVMALASAVEGVRSKLKFYAGSARRADFLLQMLSIVDELKCYRIGSRQLSEASLRLEGTLAVKTQELSMLLEGYEARCALGMQDPRDRLSLLCDHIRERGFGKDLRLYVDGFFGFTAIEVEILQAFLAQGTDITVCLCCYDLYDGAQVFSSVRRTARILMNAADRAHARVECLALPDAASPMTAQALSAFTRQAAEAGGLRLYECASPHDEAEAICADILAYVRNSGRYRDLAVACADLPAMKPILEAEFDRLGIPAFFSEKRPALRTALLGAVLCALRAAAGRMEREDVLAWLKSDCAPLTQTESDLLENYVILWDISGEMWQQRWTLHPRGFDCDMEPRDEKTLETLNSLRERCIVPLLRLRRALQKGATVGEYVLAVYEFLQATEFFRGVCARLSQLESDGQLHAAQVTRQLYELLVNALEQLYAVQFDAERSPEDFVRLMEILLSQYQVGAIPAVLDAVTVGDCAALQHRQTKRLFLCGCNDGSFPPCAAGGSLLSEQERDRLRAVGVELAPDANEQMDRALMGSYLLLCAPSDSLTVSVGGGQSAYLFSTLCKLYPDAVRPCSDAAPTDYATARTMGLRLAQIRSGADAPEEAIRYRDRLLQAGDYDFGSLSRDAVQSLYGSKLRLSASRIDRYASCRFAFFLRDGLRAQERKTAAFDAPVYGTFVHYVLEHTLRDVKDLGGIKRVDNEALQRISEKYMDEFLREKVDPILLKSQRFSYLLHRNYTEISRVVEVLGNELRAGEFVPADFELTFANGGALPPVEVQTAKNSALISGAVDRVDLFKQGDHTFFRVVDYKTGKKKFDYTDLLEGRGLQMLIYLFALREHGAAYYGTNIHPAGVLYVPAHDDLLFLSQRPEAGGEAKDREASHRREGLLLDDPILLQAMEPSGNSSPKLLPYKMQKNGPVGNLMDLDQLNLLERYVNRTLADMTDQIFGGSVTPNPYVRGSMGSCTYCPYGGVCHPDVCASELRSLKSTKPQEFWARLTQKEERNG